MKFCLIQIPFHSTLYRHPKCRGCLSVPLNKNNNCSNCNQLILAGSHIFQLLLFHTSKLILLDISFCHIMQANHYWLCLLLTNQYCISASTNLEKQHIIPSNDITLLHGILNIQLQPITAYQAIDSIIEYSYTITYFCGVVITGGVTDIAEGPILTGAIQYNPVKKVWL